MQIGLSEGTLEGQCHTTSERTASLGLHGVFEELPTNLSLPQRDKNRQCFMDRLPDKIHDARLNLTFC